MALTGITAPIGLSFVLMYLADATPLQAFAAGAALCSTSLGTTFTVLKTSGLTTSRLGVVLTSAAMLDDVVGLVMVQIISNLGPASTFTWATVVQPVGVSLAFVFFLPLVCWFVVKPLALKLRSSGKGSCVTIIGNRGVAFLFHSAIILGLVVASSYAGTSNLFAAYLAGASISWYDSDVAMLLQPVPQPAAPASSTEAKLRVKHEMAAVDEPRTEAGSTGPSTVRTNPGETAATRERNGIDCLSAVLLPVVSKSRHFVEADANASATSQKDDGETSTTHQTHSAIDFRTRTPGTGLETYEKYYASPVSNFLGPLFFASIGFSIPISHMFGRSVVWRGIVYTILMILGKFLCGIWLVRFSTSATTPNKSANDATGKSKEHSLPKPKSLYPACMLGSAMVARGEIGFLISAVAESRGIFSASGGSTDEGSSELFLIVTWAIVLCTIAGPLTVGLLAKRVRRLQSMERGSAGGREDPLGVWGMS